MKKNFLNAAALISTLFLISCTDQVMNEVLNDQELTLGQTQQLKVRTRSADPVSEGRVYVMNSDGTCVKLLETDASGEYDSGNLYAGTYDIYAIGSDDLYKMTLPTLTEASASSVIRASGEVLGDLLMAHQSVTLEDGQSLPVDLELKRKMIKIEEVKISDVPDDITGVTVRIEPLYNGITLEETYQTENGGMAYTVSLEKGEGKTWAKAPDAMLFPSKGKPIITISFSGTEGINSYVFSPSEELEANHKVKIVGSYNESQGVILSGALTSQAWGESKSVEFEFNEENKVTTPVPGGTYLGYYVVATGSRTAVLLRKAQDNKIDSETKMAEAFAAIVKKPEGEGVTSGDWRLPTPEECAAFIADDFVKGLYFNAWYYCKDGNTLKKMFNRQESDGTVTVEGPVATDYDAAIYFRPVIDITY